MDDLINQLSGLGDTAAGIIAATKGQPKPINPVATSNSSLSTYLPWIIGGGLVLLVVAFIVGRK